MQALGYPAHRVPAQALRRAAADRRPRGDRAATRSPPPKRRRCFAAIADDRVPEAAALRRILATSWWDVKLSRGLEPGDAFAHKTGDTDEVAHDGGILTLPGGARWVVVVYTELPSSDEHDARFGAFMRALRPYLLALRRSARRAGEPRLNPTRAGVKR